MTGKRAGKKPPSTPARVRAGCSVAGCRLTAQTARGLCEPHYEDLARGRGVFAPELAHGRPSGGESSPLKDRVYPGADSPHRYELSEGEGAPEGEAPPPVLDPFDVCRVAGCDRERVPGGLWCPRHVGAVERLNSVLPEELVAAAPSGGPVPRFGPGVALPDTVQGDLHTYGLKPVEIEP